MANLNQKLGANQRGRHRRVDISVHQHHVGFALEYDGLEACHDVSSLARVASRTHTEINVGRGNFELLKEHIRHVGVVVLSSMNKSLLYLGILLERAQHRRDFHQIRPGTHYVKNMHAENLPEIEFTTAETCVNCRW